MIQNNVATGSSSFGFGSVWIRFGLLLVPNLENHLVFATIVQLGSALF
jgi:hypothetical protein